MFKAFQNLGRIEPQFDAANPSKRVDQFAVAPFVKVRSDGPLFNTLTAHLVFNVMGKGPRMDWIFDAERTSDGNFDMTRVFNRKTEFDERPKFVIGPAFMAYMDFIAHTAIFAQLPNINHHRSFYALRLKQYELLDGSNGRRDMRSELKTALEQYLADYPQACTSVRKKRTSNTAANEKEIVITDEEVLDWATGPTGGSAPIPPPPPPADSAGGGGGSGSGSG